MASIHTARNIVGNDKTTPLFSLKGLSNLVPSTITALNIQGISLERQVAYTQYSANISSFIYATAMKKTITVSPAPLGRITINSALPITSPPVSFTLQKVLNSDQSDKFIKVLGPGASKTQSGKTTIYHAPAMSADTIRSVCQLSTPFFNAGRDAINPKGHLAFTFLSNIVSVFASVHSYSAFNAEDEGSITMFEQLVGGPIGGVYTAKLPEDDSDDDEEVDKEERDMSDKSYTLNEFNKRVRGHDEMDEDSPMLKIVKESDGYVTFRGNETVVKARPVKRNSINIGSSSEIPRSTGLIFPYFHGLIQPDAVFMNSIILRRFYQLLGSSHEMCQSYYLDIRHGVNSLATTERGMEICHMLLGIDTALDTQSRCFIIIEKGKYLGFSLLGAKFAIFCNSKWHAPANEKDLSSAILTMDPHESAVADMIKRFEVLQSKNQLDRTVERSVFDEPQTLADVVGRLEVSKLDDDDIRELDRCIRNLNYMGTGYLTKNPQMITEMLATIASNKTIVLERPTYLPSIRAPLSSRVFAALSKFGPDAPSFWNDRGKEILCKPTENSIVTTGGKRKIGKTDDFGNMPVRVLITPKPLLIAVQDMNKVIEKGRVKMDIDERAARYRNISVEHEETRKLMWKELVNICSDSGKKQKPVEEESSGGIDLDDLLFKLIG